MKITECPIASHLFNASILGSFILLCDYYLSR